MIFILHYNLLYRKIKKFSRMNANKDIVRVRLYAGQYQAWVADILDLRKTLFVNLEIQVRNMTVLVIYHTIFSVNVLNVVEKFLYTDSIYKKAYSLEGDNMIYIARITTRYKGETSLLLDAYSKFSNW